MDLIFIFELDVRTVFMILFIPNLTVVIASLVFYYVFKSMLNILTKPKTCQGLHYCIVSNSICFYVLSSVLPLSVLLKLCYLFYDKTKPIFMYSRFIL